MDIRDLTIVEIRKAYKDHLENDFPGDELKPLNRIESSLNEGKYRCLGAFESDELVSYAFFVFEKGTYLLDYFAVVPKLRGKGIGTDVLKSVVRLTDADLLLIEVEDPLTGPNISEREKRYRFYLRAGAIDTHVKVMCFGVSYLLLEYPVRSRHSEEEISEGYKAIYRSILPEKMFRENVLV